jgi:GxxExxY protein
MRPEDGDQISGFAEPTPELDGLAYGVIGAEIEVHRVLGPGYLEGVYEEALCVELRSRGVAFERQVPITLTYKGHPVGEARMDLVVDERLLVELKAVEGIAPVHVAQLLSYLTATGLTLGLVVNFNVPLLRDGIRRVVQSRSRSSPTRRHPSVRS